MLTELSIINKMLASIGVDGLTSSDTSHPDYARAKDQLDINVTSTLKLGFWFNTTYPTYTPNAQGEILLPNGTMHTDPCDIKLNYVQRGRKLYDMTNRTFKFAVGSQVQVKHIAELTIDELPETVKEYIMRSAVYEFYMDQDGDERRLDRLERSKGDAWIALYREHLRNRDINRMDSPAMLRMARGSRISTNAAPIGGIFRR